MAQLSIKSEGGIFAKDKNSFILKASNKRARTFLNAREREPIFIVSIKFF
jgi:hypothetical protein